jgi:hypothetical protein
VRLVPDTDTLTAARTSPSSVRRAHYASGPFPLVSAAARVACGCARARSERVVERAVRRGRRLQARGRVDEHQHWPPHAPMPAARASACTTCSGARRWNEARRRPSPPPSWPRRTRLTRGVRAARETATARPGRCSTSQSRRCSASKVYPPHNEESMLIHATPALERAHTEHTAMSARTTCGDERALTVARTHGRTRSKGELGNAGRVRCAVCRRTRRAGGRCQTRACMRS